MRISLPDIESHVIGVVSDKPGVRYFAASYMRQLCAWTLRLEFT